VTKSAFPFAVFVLISRFPAYRRLWLLHMLVRSSAYVATWSGSSSRFAPSSFCRIWALWRLIVTSSFVSFASFLQQSEASPINPPFVTHHSQTTLGDLRIELGTVAPGCEPVLVEAGESLLGLNVLSFGRARIPCVLSHCDFV
jgi:hypothetical protein